MKRIALAAAALVLVAAAGGLIGGSLARGGTGPATAAEPPARAADTGTTPAGRGQVTAPAPSDPIAEVRGNHSGTTLGLLSLRRAGAKVLVATFRVSADRSADQNDLDELAYDFSRLQYGEDVSAAELRDEGTGRANRPAVTEARECDCSSFDGVRPGQSVDLGATFRLPTDEGPFTLRTPGFPEIGGVVPAGD